MTNLTVAGQMAAASLSSASASSASSASDQTDSHLACLILEIRLEREWEGGLFAGNQPNYLNFFFTFSLPFFPSNCREIAQIIRKCAMILQV